MQIYKEFSIEAAHRLPNVPEGPQMRPSCTVIRFRCQSMLKALLGAQTGWIMDFGDIKAAFAPIYDQLDHHYLNDVVGLENPTSENLALWIWQKLKPRVALLVRYYIKETCTSGCVYRG